MFIVLTNEGLDAMKNVDLSKRVYCEKKFLRVDSIIQ